ncbi:MAG: hypothetical protein ABFD18_20685 [Syntrophomonas sp.]
MELTLETLKSQGDQLAQNTMVPANTDSAATKLDVTFVTANTIGLKCNTMPGNHPNDYANLVAIWQNAESIPWGTDPIKTMTCTENTPSFDMVFPGLDITNNSYIVGYAVGSELVKGQKYGNICATAYIPAIGDASAYPAFSPSLKVTYIGTNSVAVDFVLPSGQTPQTNGAWIGIWPAEQASYNNPPRAANSIQVDSYAGTAFINGIKIGRGLTYTVALFTSGWGGGTGPNNQHMMACSVTFTNQ